MDSIFHTLFYFVVAIGILVAFHEFGHFWVARKLGVKVLRFSIGFGKVFWHYQKTPQSTEYALSVIPLGGYVKMVDEREGKVAPEDLPFAFNRQPLLSRTLIVLAGPVFNLLLAVVLFWCVFLIGETGIKPFIGPVESGTIAAEAGFIDGDEILAVNNKLTPIWSEAMGTLISTALLEKKNVDVQVRTADGFLAHRIVSVTKEISEEPDSFYKNLGLVPWVPKLKPVIGQVLVNEAALQAGLQEGDFIISADGQPINHWMQWVGYVHERPDIMIALVIERDGVHIPVEITPQPFETDKGINGRIGASVLIPEDLMDTLTVTYTLPPVDALKEAIERTWYYSATTLKMMGYMLIGEASVENLSGPIGIAQFAGKSASMGLVPFLRFLALVSISLGVLNLLPIPVLDGGHLLFYLIEALKGNPVSDKVQIVFQQLGIAALFTLMAYAIFLDIGRVLV